MRVTLNLKSTFAHSFIKYLSSAWYLPYIALGTCSTLVSKTDPGLMKLNIPAGRRRRQTAINIMKYIAR